MRCHWTNGWGFWALAAAALVSAHAGCNTDNVSMGRDDLQATGGTTGSGNSGNSGSSGTGGTGGQPGSGGSGGSPSPADGAGGSGAGGAGSCEGFENTKFQDEVTVRYVNAGSQPIYVGDPTHDCVEEPHFLLLAASGQQLAFGKRDCDSCERFQQGPRGCFSDCPHADLVRIDPGGSHDFTWPGTYWAPIAMPRHCYAPDNNWPDTHDTCPTRVPAESSTYRIVGRAWSDFGCADGPLPCDQCMPTETGSCVVRFVGLVKGSSRQVTGTLEYPGAKFVELRFE